MLTILFDGIAYGMLMFVLAVGLAITLGLHASQIAHATLQAVLRSHFFCVNLKA